MHNHCENDLYMLGDSADIDEVLKFVAGPDSIFDFRMIVPYPTRLAEMDDAMDKIRELAYPEPRTSALKEYAEKYGVERDGYNHGGYEWCLKNWGTKWNAYNVVRRDFERVCISFKTAWLPPTPVVIALSKRFPKVTFSLEWFERGWGKCGGFACLSVHDAEECWEASYKGIRGG